jgi:hypothetical protein
VIGPQRHYILVALTHHPRGDEYLERFATAVDDCIASGGPFDGGSPELQPVP